MIERTNFIGYPVDNLKTEELLYFIDKAIASNEKHYIAVQNANKMYLSEKYPELKKGIDSASIILPENAINMGMRWLGKPLKERNIGGVHVMEKLLAYANKNHLSIYLLGARQENLISLIKKINLDFPNISVVGYRNGYFKDYEVQKIVENINLAEPNFLFVGLGSPKQEFFIIQNITKLSINFALGVGGSFNVIAGLEKPAPKWTKFGLEWLYRSFHDPKKIKRYVTINSYFMISFLKYILIEKK